MYVLAVETATLSGSVAIGKIESGKSKIIYSKRWFRQRSHGELLTASIEEGLSVAEIDANAIDLLALDIGPGSFTGIRVGLSVVKSLGYGVSRPIVPLSSMQVLAANVPVMSSKQPLVTLINAHKTQVYIANHSPKKDGWKMIGQPKAVAISNLDSLVKKKCICVGDGFEAIQDQLSSRLKSRLSRIPGHDDYPQAQTMVQLLVNKRLHSKSLRWDKVEALYIRASEAEEKLKAGLLKPLPPF
jgi:tRNA threonylcarbamoyladenosine biosynthesis protein TsaB